MILAGDIGGTKARLALYDHRLEQLHVETYPTAGAGSLVALVDRFLSGLRAGIEAACFGVAATVRGGSATGVNLPWPVYAHELAEALELPRVILVNDLEANASAIDLLAPADLAVVHEGVADPHGNRAVLSAGTGLGEAALWWDGERHRASGGEGGHADFAPRSEIEIALYRFLAREYGHVSYERVCSGMGLSNIYRFLCGRDADPAEIAEEAARLPLSPAAHALDLFTSIYGARAGNVALAVMATGGVYLGGGIPPKIFDRLTDGRFVQAFVGKGRFTPLLEQIPVQVILDDQAALMGAARIAAEAAASHPTTFRGVHGLAA